MGDVSVSASVGNASTFGLSGTLTISSLDYNSAAVGFARLDWAQAFDLDGDGRPMCWIRVRCCRRRRTCRSTLPRACSLP